jgi:hypothetical protein
VTAPDEHGHEEEETDRLIDEWHDRQPGFTSDQLKREEGIAMAAIRRVSAKLEERERCLLDQNFLQGENKNER